MKLLCLDHIAYAIQSREQVKWFKERLNITHIEKETIENQGVDVFFLFTDKLLIELIMPLEHNVKLKRFIMKRQSPCFHHLAFSVPQLQKTRMLFESAGVEFTQLIEKGSHNRSISFIKPFYTNGVLIELCESKSVNE